jgi:hypothetical protein
MGASQCAHKIASLEVTQYFLINRTDSKIALHPFGVEGADILWRGVEINALVVPRFH